jgi:hypothetical protein
MTVFYGNYNEFQKLVKTYGNITLKDLWRKVWVIKNAHLFIKESFAFLEDFGGLLEQGDFKYDNYNSGISNTAIINRIYLMVNEN